MIIKDLQRIFLLDIAAEHVIDVHCFLAVYDDIGNNLVILTVFGALQSNDLYRNLMFAFGGFYSCFLACLSRLGNYG